MKTINVPDKLITTEVLKSAPKAGEEDTQMQLGIHK